MYKSITFFIAQLNGTLVSIVIDTGHQTDVRTIAAGCLHLADGSAFGQTDEALDAIVLCSQCHTLGMVSGRTCNHTAGFLLIGELRNLVTSASHLETTGYLQVLRFQINVGFGIQTGSLNQICPTNHLAQNISGLVKTV